MRVVFAVVIVRVRVDLVADRFPARPQPDRNERHADQAFTRIRQHLDRKPVAKVECADADQPNACGMAESPDRPRLPSITVLVDRYRGDCSYVIGAGYDVDEAGKDAAQNDEHESSHCVVEVY